MKLSQLTTKEAIAKILKLTPVVKEFLKDRELLTLWHKGYSVEPNVSAEEIEAIKTEFGIAKIMDLISLLLDKHDLEVYKVLAIMEDKEVAEIQEQPLSITIFQLKELLSDKEFMSLFTT